MFLSSIFSQGGKASHREARPLIRRQGLLQGGQASHREARGNSHRKWWSDSLWDISNIVEISWDWYSVSYKDIVYLEAKYFFLIKQAKMETGHPWNLQMSSLGLLKAAKLVIVRSLFCNFSMNTKPGRTAFA